MKVDVTFFDLDSSYEGLKLFYCARSGQVKTKYKSSYQRFSTCRDKKNEYENKQKQTRQSPCRFATPFLSMRNLFNFHQSIQNNNKMFVCPFFVVALS